MTHNPNLGWNVCIMPLTHNRDYRNRICLCLCQPVLWNNMNFTSQSVRISCNCTCAFQHSGKTLQDSKTPIRVQPCMLEVLQSVVGSLTLRSGPERLAGRGGVPAALDSGL